MSGSQSTPPLRFLCVKELPDDAGDDCRRCVEQCWQCQHIEEVEKLGEPLDDDEEEQRQCFDRSSP